jgi:hypothetical protein
MVSIIRYDFRANAKKSFMPGIYQAIPTPFSSGPSVKTQIYNEAVDMHEAVTDVVLFRGKFEDDDNSPIIVGQTKKEHNLLAKGLAKKDSCEEMTAVFLGEIFSPGRTPYPVPVLGKASRVDIAFYGWGGYHTEEGQLLKDTKESILSLDGATHEGGMTPDVFADIMLDTMRDYYMSRHLFKRKNDGTWFGTSEMLLRHSINSLYDLEKRMLDIERVQFHI